MKKVIKYISFACVALALTSCEEDAAENLSFNSTLSETFNITFDAGQSNLNYSTAIDNFYNDATSGVATSDTDAKAFYDAVTGGTSSEGANAITLSGAEVADLTQIQDDLSGNLDVTSVTSATLSIVAPQNLNINELGIGMYVHVRYTKTNGTKEVDRILGYADTQLPASNTMDLTFGLDLAQKLVNGQYTQAEFFLMGATGQTVLGEAGISGSTTLTLRLTVSFVTDLDLVQLIDNQ